MRPDNMVIIMSEVCMMRANGLDKNGRPMTVRGGIADIVMNIPEVRMLLAYRERLMEQYGADNFKQGPDPGSRSPPGQILHQPGTEGDSSLRDIP